MHLAGPLPVSWIPKTSSRSRRTAPPVAAALAPSAVARPAVAAFDDGQPRPRAVVVGSGPAGSLAALILAHQGWSVEVHEAREAPSAAGFDPLRSYSIVLTPRGLHALVAHGVDLLAGHLLSTACVEVEGSWNRKAGLRLKKGGAFGAGTLAVDRNALAAAIAGDALRRYPSTVRFVYSSSLSSLDLDGRQAMFAADGGAAVARGYDLIVGADGVRSAVRAAMARQIEGYAVTQKSDHMRYRVVSLPAAAHAPAVRQSCFQAWTGDGVSYSLLAPPRPGDTIQAVLVLPADPTAAAAECAADSTSASALGPRVTHRRSLGPPSPKFTFESLERHPGAMASFLATELGDAFGHNQAAIAAAGAALATAPRPPAMRSTVVSSLIGPSVVLVGDAGHSMWASLGLGCNAALETVGALGDALSAAAGANGRPPTGWALQSALEAFEASRHRHARAGVALSEGGMASGARAATYAWIARMVILFAAGKAFPWLVRPSPWLFALTSPTVGLADIVEGDNRDWNTMGRIGPAVVAAVAAIAVGVGAPGLMAASAVALTVIAAKLLMSGEPGVVGVVQGTLAAGLATAAAAGAAAQAGMLTRASLSPTVMAAIMAPGRAGVVAAAVAAAVILLLPRPGEGGPDVVDAVPAAGGS